MKGYVFISNSSKPTKEKRARRDPLILSNVSRPCVEAALDMGYKVFYGTNRDNPQELKCSHPVEVFDSNTYRSITAFKDNKKAYDNLCRVLKDNDVEVIHCNTPVGGMVGRFAGKKYKVKKVIYTAHGFHFYKGAPLFNRTVLKWAEMYMARFTDAIITMNQEDYEAAQKFKLRKGGKVYLVHGVGITLSDFEKIVVDRQEKRAELGVDDEDIVLISMGDLIARKNYPTAINAIAKAQNPHLHYFICGRGAELENLQKLSESLEVENQIHFLGFRTDVKELLRAADIFVFSTLQEGMPRSMMEAMASGLPCIASAIRGNVDLIDEGKGGFLVPAKDSDGFARAITVLSSDAELRAKMSCYNLEKIKEYDVSVVESEIREIYKEVLG